MTDPKRLHNNCTCNDVSRSWASNLCTAFTKERQQQLKTAVGSGLAWGEKSGHKAKQPCPNTHTHTEHMCTDNCIDSAAVRKHLLQ